MYRPVGYKGYGRGFHRRPHGWGRHQHGAPWMGFVALFLLFIIVSKGFLWPLLLMFGLYVLFTRHGRSEHRNNMRWGDYPEKYKNEEKRKNDDDQDEIYYV